MMDMRGRDLATVRAHTARGCTDRAVRRAPAQHEHVGAVGIVDLELGNVARDSRDLGGAQAHHAVVVLGVVGDVAGLVLLLQAADPVLEPRRARNRPGPGKRLGVALVREEVVAVVGVGRKPRRDVGQRSDVRDEPRLRAVGEIRVREQEDRRAVLHGDARSLDRGVEASRRCRRSDDGHGRLRVAPEQDHEQIRLLRLGRHAGGRPCPLHVDHDERELEGHRETHRLRLQDDARPRRGGHAECAPERSSESSARRRDLVFGLERADAELLQRGELLEDVGRGGDRVRAEEQRKPRELARGDEAVGQRRVARDLAVRPGRGLRRCDLVRAREVLRRLAVVPARLERLRVRLDDLGTLRELGLDEPERPVGRTVVQPRHEPEREEVLRALGLARRDAVDPLQRLDRHRREGDRMHVEVGQRAVLERVRLVARLLQVPVVEGVGVDDDRPALREVAQVHLERRGVHRHEHARLVARREDVVVGEMDLEARHTGQRPGRRADLRREVGKRREVVPEDRRLAREAVTRELHPVTRVAREADDDPFEALDGLRCSHSRGIAEPRDGRESRRPAAKAAASDPLRRTRRESTRPGFPRHGTTRLGWSRC